MSKYDYRDPGCDPAYCDGLQPRDHLPRVKESTAARGIREARAAIKVLEYAVDRLPLTTIEREEYDLRLREEYDRLRRLTEYIYYVHDRYERDRRT